MKNHYVYPAVVKWDEKDKVFYINFVDIENAFTFSKTEDDIITSAKEVLELCIYDLETERKTIPAPTRITEITTKEHESILLVDVWMIPVRDYFENKSIKKTLTIPKWLNEIADEKKVNFSAILQSALKEYLGLK